MPADPTASLSEEQRQETTADDIGHVAPDFDREDADSELETATAFFNTLVIRPQYRISLRLGNIEELFEHAPNTPEGRMERLQVLGLFYFPLRHRRAMGRGEAAHADKRLTALNGLPADPAPGGRPRVPGAWDYFVNNIVVGATDPDEEIQILLQDWVVEYGQLPPPADDPENPDFHDNFAKLRLPGGYTMINADGAGTGSNDDSAYTGLGFEDDMYDAESTYYRDNDVLRKIPLVALVEQRDPATNAWRPAEGAWVYFQLLQPYDLPEFDPGDDPANPSHRVNEELDRPPLRESTVGGGTAGAAQAAGAGPRKLDDEVSQRNPHNLEDDDPQRHNAPRRYGGKAGRGSVSAGTNVAAWMFRTQSTDGFNTEGDRTEHEPYPLAERVAPSGDSHKHAVKAQTNSEGEAGVIFMPSRCGGDRYRFRAYVGPDTLANDGSDERAVRVDTGTLVVWRSIRISRYVQMPYAGTPHTDLVTQFQVKTGIPAGPDNADEYLERAHVAEFNFGTGSYTRHPLPEADLDETMPVSTFAAGQPFDRIVAQFARAFCEVVLDGRLETLTDAEWNQARQQALRDATEGANDRSLNLDLERLLFLEATSPLTVANSVTHLPMRTDTAYNAGLPLNQQIDPHEDAAATEDEVERLWWDYMLSGFIRALTHDGFMPGLTVVQAAYGSSWQLCGTPRMIGDSSGYAVQYAGAFVWAGQAFYPTPPPRISDAVGCYDYTSNVCHELGHCLYREHAPGDPPPGSSAAGGIKTALHDTLTDCICVMSYARCEGQFCAKCLYALRGWDMREI